MAAAARRKLLIDADTGIDDAMALVLALDAHKRGEAEVLGITCVNGNTAVEHSRVNVLRVLDVMGCPKVRRRKEGRKGKHARSQFGSSWTNWRLGMEPRFMKNRISGS